MPLTTQGDEPASSLVVYVHRIWFVVGPVVSTYPVWAVSWWNIGQSLAETRLLLDKLRHVMKQDKISMVVNVLLCIFSP